MENEIWKECYESDRCIYEISNMGRLRYIWKINKPNKIVSNFFDRKGYYFIRFDKKKYAIHHLVTNAFLGERPDGLIVDHIDRNRQNNRLDNLRYVTTHQNNINSSNYRTDILEKDPKERHRIINNTKINCPCGSITTNSNKSRHEKSEKHKKYLNTLL